MGSSAPCARAHTQPPQPAKEGKQEAKAAAAAAKMATGGKRGKKDEKKHPQCLFVCKGHTGEITCSRISMTGKMMCSTGEDRKVILWNIAALPPTAQLTFSPELDHGAAIAMSPDDKFFAVVFARSKEVKIFPTKGAKEGAQVTRCERPRLAQPA
jgi:WD40 repeat protein